MEHTVCAFLDLLGSVMTSEPTEYFLVRESGSNPQITMHKRYGSNSISFDLTNYRQVPSNEMDRYVHADDYFDYCKKMGII